MKKKKEHRQGGWDEFTSPRYGEWMSERMQKEAVRERKRGRKGGKKSNPNNFHPVGA